MRKGNMRRSSWLTMWLLPVLLCILQAGVTAAAPAPVEITWWQSWTNTPAAKDFLEDAAARFEKAYPHIKVKLEYVIWNQVAPKATVAIAGGSPPDVLMLMPEDYAAFAHNGMLRPLNDLIAKERVNMSAFLPADAAKSVYEGKVYGLPHISGGASNFLLINRTRFEESGLPAVPPTTWESLAATAKRLTRSSGSEITHLGLGGLDFDMFLSLLASNNSSFVSNDGKRAQANSPEALETLNFMINTQDSMGGRSAIAAFGAAHSAPGADANFPIYTGAVAVTRGYQALFKHINNVAKDFQYGVGVIPFNQAKPQASGHGFADTGWFMVIPNSVPAAKQEAAFLWIKWMTAMEDGGAKFAMIQGRPSPLRKVNLDKGYYDTNPEWANVIKVLETDVSPVITPVYGKVKSTLQKAFNSVIQRQTSPETAMEEAQRLMQQLINDFYRAK